MGFSFHSLGPLLLCCAAAVPIACTTQRPPSAQPKFAVERPRTGGASATVAGEVLGADERAPEEHNQMTLKLQVQPRAQRPVTVHLGPGWYFTEHGIEFHPHDQVVVEGTASKVNGQTVIVAHRLRRGDAVYRRPPGDTDGNWGPDDSAPDDSAPDDSAPDDSAPGGADDAAGDSDATSGSDAELEPAEATDEQPGGSPPAGD